jgi:phytoene/squalene synthetase
MSELLEYNPLPEIIGAQTPHSSAAAITWNASKQTYYTIRLLVDRDRVSDAYNAYGYFRWLDDQLDQGALDLSTRTALVARQQALIDRCYRGDFPQRLCEHEDLLVRLIRGDKERSSGLQSYVRHMMAVMAFDVQRRGRWVSAAELAQYTRWLAVAVTEAMHHFIGHGRRAPQGENRYHAVTAAHITHMLRDTLEDTGVGYFNIPREALEAHQIDPLDVSSVVYRSWVRRRVNLARHLFASGRAYLRQVENSRCRLAGYAYMARFENVLKSIERDEYCLRAAYPERESLRGGIRVGWFALTQTIRAPRSGQLLPQITINEGA